MKKIAIITAIILTTGATAFSLTRQENKVEISKVKIGNINAVTVNHTTVSLATAE